MPGVDVRPQFHVPPFRENSLGRHQVSTPPPLGTRDVVALLIHRSGRLSFEVFPPSDARSKIGKPSLDTFFFPAIFQEIFGSPFSVDASPRFFPADVRNDESGLPG